MFSVGSIILRTLGFLHFCQVDILCSVPLSVTFGVQFSLQVPDSFRILLPSKIFLKTCSFMGTFFDNIYQLYRFSKSSYKLLSAWGGHKESTPCDLSRGVFCYSKILHHADRFAILKVSLSGQFCFDPPCHGQSSSLQRTGCIVPRFRSCHP